jgi:predicted kinase
MSNQQLTMTKLILLIGLPGSGKSTLASQLVAAYPGSYLVSTDAIRAQLFGSEAVQGEWLRVWRQVRWEFQQAAQCSPVVIYDATNAIRRYRREAIALARETGFNFLVGLWLDTPVAVCLEQNQRRDRTVPEDVILRMNASLVDAPPAQAEGFDYLIRYSSARCGNCDRMSEKEPNSTNLTTLLP